MTRFLLFLMTILVGASCFNEPDCIVTATTAIKLDFKQTKTNSVTLIKSVVDSAVIFSYVNVAGISGKYLKDTTTATLSLPINPKEKTITYYLFRQSESGASTRLDSIKFSFTEETRVIAPRCGAYTFFLDLKVVQTSFSQTQYKITNNRLLKNTTNVQIFL